MRKHYDYRNSNYRRRDVIESDVLLFLRLIVGVVGYLLLLLPRLISGVLMLLTGYREQGGKYLRSLISGPFLWWRELRDWFFQGKVTATLILVLVLIYLAQVFILSGNTEVVQQLMVHPDHLFEGNYHSLLTSMFLHADLVHLLSNLVGLLLFGRLVERHFGANMVWIFLGSGIFANLVSNAIAWIQEASFYSLGASGGIAGLVMFAILLEPFTLTSLLVIPLPAALIGWVLIGLDIIGLTNPSEINRIAHLGGYSALLVLFFFIEFRYRRKILRGLFINVGLLAIFWLLFRVTGIALPW